MFLNQENEICQSDLVIFEWFVLEGRSKSFLRDFISGTDIQIKIYLKLLLKSYCTARLNTLF